MICPFYLEHHDDSIAFRIDHNDAAPLLAAHVVMTILIVYYIMRYCLHYEILFTHCYTFMHPSKP